MESLKVLNLRCTESAGRKSSQAISRSHIPRAGWRRLFYLKENTAYAKSATPLIAGRFTSAA